MGWASGTEAAEKGQVLGVDVKVEDDSHQEVQQAEKEHCLADPLQRPPQQSAHPAGGQRPAQWAQASGCQPEQGERNRSHRSGQDRTGNATHLLPTWRLIHRPLSSLTFRKHLETHGLVCILPANTPTAAGNSSSKTHPSTKSPRHTLQPSLYTYTGVRTAACTGELDYPGLHLSTAAPPAPQSPEIDSSTQDTWLREWFTSRVPIT